jgi:hypothetical protein
MSDRRDAFVDVHVPISSIPELKAKRHLAYTHLLGLPFLTELYGTESLAKRKRDHTRRYLQRFVDTLIENEQFNGSIREFLDILKERLREKVAAGLSASPPKQARRPSRVSPPRAPPPPPPPPAQVIVVAVPQRGIRRQRSSSSTAPSSSSQSNNSNHSNEGRTVRNPTLNRMTLALGNMNVGENQGAISPSRSHLLRPPQRRRRIDRGPSQLTSRQLATIAATQANAQAEEEARIRRESTATAARQRRRDAPERRAAVNNLNDLINNFGI